MTHEVQPRVSAAIFCPQNKPPDTAYLDDIRRYIRSNERLRVLEQAILDMPKTLAIYIQANQDIARLEDAPRYCKEIHDWLAEGTPLAIPKVMSGILALPLLTIIQIVQYFQYLESRDLSHQEFLHEIRFGGAQGFCGGLLPALAIASSKTETEVAHNAAKSLRIALGIGAYGELGDDPTTPGPTTLVLRSKYVGQAEAIVVKLPGVHVSAVTDPLSISVVGSVKMLAQLKAYAESEGVPVTQVNLRGRVHNPENQELSTELCRLCDNHDELRLPSPDQLQVPVRANSTGQLLSKVPLSHEVVMSTLVTRCEWYTLLQAMSLDLKSSGEEEHKFAMFGTGRKNCIPPSAFETSGLRVTKLDIPDTLAGKASLPKLGFSPSDFPEDTIAIVGVACRLPGATSLDELWDLIRDGKSKAEELPRQRLDGNLASRLGQSGGLARKTWYGNFISDIEGFDNAFFNVSTREALHMDPQQRLLLETAYEALDSSGYLRNHKREAFDNVGCFIGSTYTEYLENTTAYSPSAYAATGTIRAFQSGKISYHFGWSGPSEVIDTACSSSLVAIHRACKAIQSGECPMALAGGVNIITGIQNFLDLGKAGFLSPTGQCKPFDTSANGYCRADGVGLVVLKNLSQALAQGDQIFGVIPAVATRHGGLSQSITVPYSRAQTDLFTTVLRKSRLKASDISYIEAHGTGTQVGDPIEIASIRQVLGGRQKEQQPLYLGSVKANIGHSEAAAGVGSLMKVLAMLWHQRLPPLAGFQTLNAQIPPLEPDNLHINSQLLPWNSPSRAALINSYGAAGSHSALICCEAPSRTTSGVVSRAEDAGLTYPIFLSARSAWSLQETAAKLAAYIRKNSNLHIGDVALTLHERRKHHNVQWVGTAVDLKDLSQSLEAGLADGQFDVTSRAQKPVVLLFSGQSRQNIQLPKTWHPWFPRLRIYIERCDEILKDLGHPSIISAIFQSDAIDDVVALQCGTFAVQYACAKCWQDAGIQIQAVIGHSFGELTGLAICNVLSLENAMELVATRACLMRDNWGSERGTMLSINATREVVSDIIAATLVDTPSGSGLETGSGLEIACFNGPKSHVVVGSTSEMSQLEAVMDRDPRFNNIKRKRVDVTHGFHSVFTEPLLQDLGALAKRFTFNRCAIPLVSCTQEPLDAITPDDIVRHARMPVYFSDAVSRVEKQLGSCIWLEAGSGTPIVPMAKAAVRNAASHVFLPMKADNANAITDATAALWREGVPAHFWCFIPPIETRFQPVWLPPYQFQRNKHYLAWIDPVNEDRKATTKRSAAQTTAEEPISRKLVTPFGSTSSTLVCLEFSLHTTSNRYVEIVSGHAVRGRPLCPASMYWESAVMAVETAKPDLAINTIKFDNVVFRAGLGLASGRDTRLTLEKVEGNMAWGYKVTSSPVCGNTTRPTTHSTGRLSILPHNDWQLYERVMAKCIKQLLDDPEAEKFGSSRAYSLFSRVVDYSAVLRGISHITIVGNQAVALVRSPARQVSSSESTAIPVCDAVALDTFIQVVGLLINSSASCPQDEVFIASSVDTFLMQDCDFPNSTSWTVFATVSELGPSEVAGDLLVFNSGGKLVVMGTGIKFTRYPIVQLEKSLSATSGKDSAAKAHTGKAVRLPADDVDITMSLSGFQAEACSETTSEETLLTHESLSSFSMTPQPLLNKSAGSDPVAAVTRTMNHQLTQVQQTTHADGSFYKDDAAKRREDLVKLIRDNIGESQVKIRDDDCLEDIGVDSIAVVELASAVEEAFGVSLAADQIHLQSTVAEIMGTIGKVAN